MRFTKRQRHPFTDTARKRAAVLARQRKDRDKLPLFADEIATTQKSVDDVMTARDKHWIRREIETRQAEADKWRAVRRRIAAMPDHERKLFLTYWKGTAGIPAMLATSPRSYTPTKTAVWSNTKASWSTPAGSNGNGNATPGSEPCLIKSWTA